MFGVLKGKLILSQFQIIKMISTVSNIYIYIYIFFFMSDSNGSKLPVVY